MHGYGKGESKGSAAVRFELLWRDYFRLTTRTFGPRLFRISGLRNDTSYSWKYPKDKETQQRVTRFLEGRTGTGLIDGSMRELFCTGYTSNRARQNVASFFAKHLGIDWRIGAEWYESTLVDYDLSSNWLNWQYTGKYNFGATFSSCGLLHLRVARHITGAKGFSKAIWAVSLLGLFS